MDLWAVLDILLILQGKLCSALANLCFGTASGAAPSGVRQTLKASNASPVMTEIVASLEFAYGLSETMDSARKVEVGCVAAFGK